MAKRSVRLQLRKAKVPGPLPFSVNAGNCKAVKSSNELKLDNESAVEFGTFKDLPKFLRVVGQTFPGALLHLEGSTIDSTVRRCLAPSLVQQPVHVVRGTIWPRCDRLVAVIDESLMECLSNSAEHLATPEVADHLVISTESAVLLEAYDLHDPQIRISTTLAADVREQLRTVIAFK
jgi:hypothetical protein